jgi:hypothetical protein
MIKPHQQWSVEPVAGGYMGAPYYKILIAGTTRALAATADGKLVADAAFSGTTGQLWRIDQLTDGSYRITPACSRHRAARWRLSPRAPARPCSPGSTRPAMPGAGPSRHHSRGRSLACNR